MYNNYILWNYSIIKAIVAIFKAFSIFLTNYKFQGNEVTDLYYFLNRRIIDNIVIHLIFIIC